MRSNTKSFFTYSLLLVWFSLCLTLFVYVSRFDFVQIVTVPDWAMLRNVLTRISLLPYFLDLIVALLGAILFSLACLSLGLYILQTWLLVPPSKLAQGVTSLVVGEVLYSLIFLTIISLYQLTPIFVIAVLIVGFSIGFSAFKAYIAQLPPLPVFFAFEWDEQIILVLGSIGLILGLLLSATRLGYDATAEYFSHAKIMAVSHLPVFFYPKDLFVVSSFHPGILFTAVIQLFGDQSARLLSWLNGLAILLMGLALGQELGLSYRARLWFLTLMLTSTAFLDLLGDGKIELITTAPILAAIYWMARSVQQPSKATFALIGLLSGFAIISRPYNICLVALFITLFFVGQIFVQYRTGRVDIKQLLQSVLWILPPLLVLGAFHLFQNWIWLKDPLAPLTYARGLDNTDWQWQLDPANLFFYRLLYPFTLTFLNSPQSLGNISPLFVGFLPFLLMKSVRQHLQFSALLRQLTLIAMLTLLIWIVLFFTVLEIRYVLFLWVMLFLAMAHVVENATQYAGKLIRPLLGSLMIILLAVMSIRTLIIALSTYLPPGNISQADCYNTDLCAFVDTVNQHAALGDRLFVLHAYRYYLRPDLFACSSRVGDYNSLEPLARQGSSEFWMELYRRGYRFILFEKHLSESRFNFGDLPSLDTVPDWMNVKILFSSPSANQLIYQLDVVNPPVRPEVSCKKTSTGLWQVLSSIPPARSLLNTPLSRSVQPKSSEQ